MLMELKPGSQSLHPTRTGVAPLSIDARLAVIERTLQSLMTSLVRPGSSTKALSFDSKSRPCFRFRDKGDCSAGSACPFSHDAAQAPAKFNNVKGARSSTSRINLHTCLKHGGGTHKKADCNVLNNNPAVKATLLAEASAQQANTQQVHSSVQSSAPTSPYIEYLANAPTEPALSFQRDVLGDL